MSLVFADVLSGHVGIFAEMGSQMQGAQREAAALCEPFACHCATTISSMGAVQLNPLVVADVLQVVFGTFCK